MTPSGRRDPVVSAVADSTPFLGAHADQIHLPSQATLLAFSAATPVHAFRVGAHRAAGQSLFAAWLDGVATRP